MAKKSIIIISSAFPLAPDFRTEANMSKEIVCSNTARKQALREGCKEYSRMTSANHGQSPSLYSELLSDDKHQVIYCVIPKAGCTSFKTMMANQTGRTIGRIGNHIHNGAWLKSIGLRSLRDMSPPNRAHRLKNYTKVILVRHPFDRLMSAYKDKFDLHVVFYKWYHKAIYGKFGRKYQTPGKNRITLEQFLQLIRVGYRSNFRNRHWMTYMDLCLPCEVNYDYILKMETLELENSQEPLSLFLNEEQTSVTLPHLNDRRPLEEKLASTSNKFRKLERDLVEAIMEIYKVDFDLFGYGWDELRGASCSGRVGFRKCC